MAQAFATRMKLTPQQARQVARWRFADARCLWGTERAEHMNGAVYLAGLALDCLLKARLLSKHHRLSKADPARLSHEDRRLWDLIYRSHDPGGVISALPDLVRELQSNS